MSQDETTPETPTEAPAEATEAPTEPTNAPTSEAASTSADLVGIKSYLQSYGKDYLLKGAEDLKTNADAYYDALKAANFDYAATWGEDGSTLRPLILNMREAFNTSHTGYESVEGIVAGVPSLSERGVPIRSNARLAWASSHAPSWRSAALASMAHRPIIQSHP